MKGRYRAVKKTGILGDRNIRLLLFVGGLVVFAVIAALFVFEGKLGCSKLPKSGIMVSGVYPPKNLPRKIDPKEASIWQGKVLGGSRNERLERITDQMYQSSLPTFREVAQFIYQSAGDFKVSFADDLGGNIMLVAVSGKENTMVLAIARGPFDESSDIQIALTLVHELGGHLADLFALEQSYMAEGLNSSQTFERLRQLQTDYVMRDCTEARAYALETAAYRETAAYLGYDEPGFRNEALQALVGLNWDYERIRWVNLLRPKYQK